MKLPQEDHYLQRAKESLQYVENVCDGYGCSTGRNTHVESGKKEPASMEDLSVKQTEQKGEKTERFENIRVHIMNDKTRSYDLRESLIQFFLFKEIYDTGLPCEE